MTVSLFKLMVHLFCTKNIQGRKLCWHDLMKYTFYIVMHQDTCVMICFKLGIMLNCTKLYSLILVWMTWMFAQGHRVTGSLELVQSKLHEASPLFVIVDYVREMTMKNSCQYGEYGSFHHLLFLCFPCKYHSKYRVTIIIYLINLNNVCVCTLAYVRACVCVCVCVCNLIIMYNHISILCSNVFVFIVENIWSVYMSA